MPKHTHKKPKKLPYGQKRGKHWCCKCDAALVPEEPNKTSERMKVKRKVKKEKESLSFIGAMFARWSDDLGD